MGEPTVADAVADRLLANLHRIELEGESMRRKASSGVPGADGDRHGEGPSTATDK
jgi:hypothetical protein